MKKTYIINGQKMTVTAAQVADFLNWVWLEDKGIETDFSETTKDYLLFEILEDDFLKSSYAGAQSFLQHFMPDKMVEVVAVKGDEYIYLTRHEVECGKDIELDKQGYTIDAID